MTSQAKSVQEYLEQLPEERKQPVTDLLNIIRKHLPKGFEEAISYGMIGFIVPHSTYPAGYHCDPSLPLPFISIASQKNYIAVHHMGLYASPELLSWFTEEYPKHSKTKLDMGKGCIRFKKPDQIPLELMGELASKMKPADWIATYEAAFRKKK